MRGVGAFTSAVVSCFMITFVHGAEAAQQPTSHSPAFDLTHYWGQYSPAFTVHSDINPEVPHGCHLTQAVFVSRHGARSPTASKTKTYSALVSRIQKNTPPSSLTGQYAFLQNYTYTLGADLLTPFGQEEMYASGKAFYQRYRTLLLDNQTNLPYPFIRSSGQDRVVQSSQNFSQGFYDALRADRHHLPASTFPYPTLVIPEDSGVNNTLSHGLCTAFEDAEDPSEPADFLSTFAPPVVSRLNHALPNVNFTTGDVILMMDLCPFTSVISSPIHSSSFCALFDESEWRAYDYYYTLSKYYTYGPGAALGPTQGVGWVNELIARLTHQPVHDSTSTNRTLDENAATFPLGGDRNGFKLFADFSHDNDMVGHLSALGLYANPSSSSSSFGLGHGYSDGRRRVEGFSAAETVAFAAHMNVETMQCSDKHEEEVRVLVNGRVVELPQCGGFDGRCTVSKFVKSLKFAREGGDWDECFA